MWWKLLCIEFVTCQKKTCYLQWLSWNLWQKWIDVWEKLCCLIYTCQTIGLQYIGNMKLNKVMCWKVQCYSLTGEGIENSPFSWQKWTSAYLYRYFVDELISRYCIPHMQAFFLRKLVMETWCKVTRDASKYSYVRMKYLMILYRFTMRLYSLVKSRIDRLLARRFNHRA